MNKGLITIGGILLFVFIIFMTYRSTYNSAVSLRETVDEKWKNLSSRTCLHLLFGPREHQGF